VIDALAAGLPVLFPTDTVYGLAAGAEREEHALRLYRLKGRSQAQPSALLAPDVETLLSCVPELHGRSEAIVRALLPGPYTLVLSNPACRYPWLNGDRADAIGVRVPDLPPEAKRVLAAVGCVLATSANEPGGPSPATIDDVPGRIRQVVAAELDLGPLPGTPSTVIDFTGPEPLVLRYGAASAREAIERVRAARSG
jgi:L-threonylcarbamoyladenylate synthase